MPAPKEADSPLVSFVMPAWNPQPDWLHRAVTSVLAERDFPVELVVVDDGSEPSVGQLLSHLQDPRLTVTTIPHQGVSAARNAGLAKSRGRFVRYVDCDDAIVPGSTDHLLGLRGDDTSDRLVTFGGMTYCDSELRPQWTLGCELDGEMFEPVMRGRLDAYVFCLLIPRPLLDAVGPWDESLRLCEDLDFMFRLAAHARVRGDGTPVYLYRRHVASASAQGTLLGEDPWLAVHQRHYARHPEHLGTPVERWLETAYAMDQAVQRWDDRAPLSLLRALTRALRLSPADAWHHARAEIRYRRLQRRSRRSERVGD